MYFHEEDTSPVPLTPPAHPIGSFSAPIDLSEGWFDTPVSASPRSQSPCPPPAKGHNTFACPSTSSGDEVDDVESEDDEVEIIQAHALSPNVSAELIPEGNLPRGFTDLSFEEDLDRLFPTSSPSGWDPKLLPSERALTPVADRDLSSTTMPSNPGEFVRPSALPSYGDPSRKISTFSELLLPTSQSPATTWLQPGPDALVDLSSPTSDLSPMKTPAGRYEELVALRKDRRNFMCQDECSCCDYSDDNEHAAPSHEEESKDETCPRTKLSRFDQPADRLKPKGKDAELDNKGSQTKKSSRFIQDVLHHTDHDIPQLDITALSPELLASEDGKFDSPLTPSHSGPIPAVSVVDHLQTTRSKLNSDLDRSMAYFKLPSMKLFAEEKFAFNTHQEGFQDKIPNKPLPDSRLSIGNLVNAIPEATKSDNATGQKRKASDFDQDLHEHFDTVSTVVEADPGMVSPKLSQAAPLGHEGTSTSSDQLGSVQQSCVTTTPRPTKRIKSALNSAFTATAYAALGSIATIGFLASPLAERLAGL
ncbi:hypothetical protein K461DRAFT_105732 [Myriangium duriaei CBS 260.36]|uniref:Uncharacterized protein n=1 Tax=Myriangium duriaei CBS 260.36 TaxID=1168546 RepID=A0A9P4J3Z7_9PEZI|nr:hypothetical protein K461DRAFT_105732 [Myriangium duriaei CBS 260.36]